MIHGEARLDDTAVADCAGRGEAGAWYWLDHLNSGTSGDRAANAAGTVTFDLAALGAGPLRVTGVAPLVAGGVPPALAGVRRAGAGERAEVAVVFPGTSPSWRRPRAEVVLRLPPGHGIASIEALYRLLGEAFGPFGEAPVKMEEPARRKGQ